MLNPFKSDITLSTLTQVLKVFSIALIAFPLISPLIVLAAYPTKPITLIVPYRAGGSTETMTQIFSKSLGRELNQKVIVKTKPGGGGTVGSSFVSKAKPDGYTIELAAIDSFTWEPLTRPSLPYGIDSFQMIAGITEYQMSMISTPDKPYKSLADLVEYSKQNPGLNVAEQGGLSKAIINFIAKQEGIDWTPIPTRGGGEMVPFLLGGKVDFAFSGGVHAKYGNKMFVLASFLGGRLAKDPDVPSIKEKYGIFMQGNAVIAAPKGVSQEVVTTLDAAIGRAVNDPAFEKVLKRLSFPKRYVGTKQMTEEFNNTIVAYKKLLASMK